MTILHRAAIALLIASPLAATGAAAADLTAKVRDREGNDLGNVRVRDTASGVPLATLVLSNLPTGVHGIHLHETGDCSADDFSSAGGHIAGDRQHGVLAEGGPHPGDMPNLTVHDAGRGEVEVMLPWLDIEEMMMDEDGAAFILHENPDDYETQPSGDAGDRLACGEFSQR